MRITVEETYSVTLLLAGFAFLAGNAAAQPCCADSRPLVTVRGSAELKVVPDAVDIWLGVEVRGRDLASAIEQQTGRVNGAIAIIRKAGVDAKDIQTDFASVSPVYSHSKNGRLLDYFSAKKGIYFTLKDTAQYDALMAALAHAGVDHVEDVKFRVTDIRKYRDQAREMAIAAAREKAAAMAARLDQKIGKAFGIEEDEEPANRGQAPLGYANAARNVSSEAESAGGVPEDSSLMRGQISIEARVKVRFELQ